MSKEVEWGMRHGEGNIICECDQCGDCESIYFDEHPDFKMAQTELKSLGWISRKIDDNWYDFCCEQCYYDWIKENK